MTRILTRYEREMRMMAAVSSKGASGDDLRTRLPGLSEREYGSTLRDLMAQGAIRREGTGRTGVLVRDLLIWARTAGR